MCSSIKTKGRIYKMVEAKMISIKKLKEMKKLDEEL